MNINEYIANDNVVFIVYGIVIPMLVSCIAIYMKKEKRNQGK